MNLKHLNGIPQYIGKSLLFFTRHSGSFTKTWVILSIYIDNGPEARLLWPAHVVLDKNDM